MGRFTTTVETGNVQVISLTKAKPLGTTKAKFKEKTASSGVCILTTSGQSERRIKCWICKIQLKSSVTVLIALRKA